MVKNIRKVLFVFLILSITNCFAETESKELIELFIQNNKRYYFEGEDTPQIYLGVKKDLYLYVFHKDATGKALLLWPDPVTSNIEDSFLTQKDKKIIPSAYYFSGKHSGMEQIQAFGYFNKSESLEKKLELYVQKAFVGEYILPNRKNSLPEPDICRSISFYYNVPREKVFVFAIGIDQYRESAVRDLSTPSNDATRFVEQIRKNYSGQSVVESVLLTNEKATKENIIAFFSGGIDEYIDKTTTVYVYFSGHGTQIPDENGDEKDHFDEALVPCDFSYYNIYNTLLIDDHLYEYYKKIGKKSKEVFIIIDACYSAESLKGSKGILYDTSLKASDQQNVDAMEDEIKKLKENFVFLSASGGDQIAMEDPEDNLSNSIFTFYLLKAFEGNADENGDDHITPEEILNYCGTEMKKWFKERNLPVQTPVLINPDRINFMIPTIGN
jgi:hypothetical protein